MSANAKHNANKGLVLSAMSGGVDSSVATTLLLQNGYDVTGVTMWLFDNNDFKRDELNNAPENPKSEHQSSSDIEDAKDICQKLGIQHVTLDFEDMFRTHVINQFCNAYMSGLTPNPCIECNRHLKFAGLQRYRREVGADFVATGHYVRKRFNPKTNKWELLRAKDPNKDQSYVLYHLTQDDLEHMLFPLGELSKPEVRELAKQHGFTNASKRDSQDICFIPDNDHVSFIKRFKTLGEATNTPTASSENANNSARTPNNTNTPPCASAITSMPPFAPGDIVDIEGKKLGQHNGLINYTIGQRKGIGVASSEPLYVWEKDIERNLLIVAHRSALTVNEATITDVNMISSEYDTSPLKVQVKTNYNQKPIEAEFELTNQPGKAFANNHKYGEHSEVTPTCHKAVIRFAEPQIKPARGQSAVIYDGEVVLGGGVFA